MGCGDPAMTMPPRKQNTGPVQNYNNNNSTMFYQMQNAKRPRFLNPQPISQQQRDALWAVIQRNSLKQFAYFIQNQRIPSNIQIGAANTFWNFAHFCARWDAFQCLQYIIKRVYAQNSSLILSLMNQQTIEGYTAIHVAIQWNALSCFYMMINYGAVDLSYKDNANNDVFAKASLFKRQQMLQILQQFRAGNALMIIAQSDKLRGFQNFSQMVASNKSQNRKQFRISKQRIAQVIDTRNRINRPPPPIPPVQNNTNNFSEYNKAMKQIQTKKNQMSAQQSQGISEKINRQKLQQQRKFQQNQALIKKQQAENMKNAMIQQQQQQQKRLRAEVKQQIQRERAYQQAQLQKIQKQKEQMRKNIQAMQSNINQVKYNGKTTKMTCPQDIKGIYEAALQKKAKFVDMQFSASSDSLGDTSQFKFGWSDCVWLRPEQMFPGGNFQVFDGISPDDIKQGTLGVCYYLALLSSLAQHQQRVKKVFKFYDKELGFYALQFYLEGKPITMIVDDLIPCMKGTNQPLFSKPRGAEIWVMIFEKAWVKMFGSYLAAQKMSPSDMFENVLPSPSKMVIIDVSKIDQYFDKLMSYDKNNYVMVTSSTKPAPGIVQDHAYSLIGVYNFNGVKLCKVRNPWAKTQYEGMYCDSSPLWTPELKNAVGFKKQDDGVFFLTPTQLQDMMAAVTVGFYRDDNEYSFIQVKSKSNQDVYYVITVKKKCEINVKVTQQNQRFHKNMQFQNSAIRLQIYKIQQNYDAKIFSEGEYSCMFDGAANLFSNENIYETFEPGRYMIRLRVEYDRTQRVSTRGTLRKFIRGTNGKDVLIIREGKCILSTYGPDKYVFNRLSVQQAQKYLKNAYLNVIKSSQKCTERLRSVGQDLKPMVLAKDCKMKNQIIYYAENLIPSNSINFKFVFHYQKFRNCSYAYNINKETQCAEWILPPGGWNLLTLDIDCPFQQIATEGQLGMPFKIIR